MNDSNQTDGIDEQEINIVRNDNNSSLSKAQQDYLDNRIRELIDSLSVRPRNVLYKLIGANSPIDALYDYIFNKDDRPHKILRIKNVGKGSILELTHFFSKIDSLLDDIRNGDIIINIQEPIEDNNTTNEQTPLTTIQICIIDPKIKELMNNLSVRSRNAISVIIGDGSPYLSLSSLISGKNDRLNHIKRIKNIGKHSIPELLSFFDDIDYLIAQLSNQTGNHFNKDFEERAIGYIQFLSSTFHLSDQHKTDILLLFIQSEKIPIFSVINYLVENGLIYSGTRLYVFKNVLQFYNNGNTISLDGAAQQIQISKERVRQICQSISEKLFKTFSFLHQIAIEDISLYDLSDFDDKVYLFNRKFGDTINSSEKTNFSLCFIARIFSIVLSGNYLFFGEKGKPSHHPNRLSHYYLIRNGYLHICDLAQAINKIKEKNNERRIDAEYIPINKFIRISYKKTVEGNQIFQTVLKNETGLEINDSKFLVFPRTTELSYLEIVETLIAESGTPITISNLFSVSNKKYPNIFESESAVRSACQRNPNIVSYGRKSTYGLKCWSGDVGGICELVAKYLSCSSTPLHALELERLISKTRVTSAASIHASILLDTKVNNTFIVFPQYFIGLLSKSETELYKPYNSIPKKLGRTIVSIVNKHPYIFKASIISYISEICHINASHSECIIDYLVLRKSLISANGLISCNNYAE